MVIICLPLVYNQHPPLKPTLALAPIHPFSFLNHYFCSVMLAVTATWINSCLFSERTDYLCEIEQYCSINKRDGNLQWIDQKSWTIELWPGHERNMQWVLQHFLPLIREWGIQLRNSKMFFIEIIKMHCKNVKCHCHFQHQIIIIISLSVHRLTFYFSVFGISL